MTTGPQNHDHDRAHFDGLARDLPRRMGRRNVLVTLGALGLGSIVAARVLGGPPGSTAEANLTGTGPQGTCRKDSAETSGRFPADGTNAKKGRPSTP